MHLFHQFVLADFEFLAQQPHRAVHGMAQHVGHGEELRLIVLDDAAVGRKVDFAIGEGIERIDGLVGRDSRREVHLHFHVGRSEVGHVLGLDFPLFDGFGDAFAKGADGLGERQVADDERLVVELLNLGAYFQYTASLAVVVFRNVDRAPRGEVGIEPEFLSVKVFDGGIADVVEVVGQNLR